MARVVHDPAILALGYRAIIPSASVNPRIRTGGSFVALHPGQSRTRLASRFDPVVLFGETSAAANRMPRLPPYPPPASAHLPPIPRPRDRRRHLTPPHRSLRNPQRPRRRSGIGERGPFTVVSCANFRWPVGGRRTKRSRAESCAHSWRATRRHLPHPPRGAHPQIVFAVAVAVVAALPRRPAVP